MCSPLSVQGCVDSVPLHTTEECHYASHVQLSLHGLNLHLLCPDSSHNSQHFSTSRCTSHVRKHYSVYVGPFPCRSPRILSKYALSCTVDKGAGKNLDVVVYKTEFPDQNTEKTGSGSGEEGERGEVVGILEEAVSFKEAINFREKFDKFSEMGVGGMKKEIDELYRRAFASRGEPFLLYPPLSL